MIKRAYAPPDERLRLLIAREKAMPAALAEARKNLDNPPKISTQIAIEQLDGSQRLLQDRRRGGVPGGQGHGAARRVQGGERRGHRGARRLQEVAAERPAAKRANGDFAIGADTYAKKLAADEMVELPLDELLAIAEKDLTEEPGGVHRDREADRSRRSTPMQVLAKVQAEHPPAAKLLSVTQAELDSIGRFMTDHHIVTVPQAAPARVQETPPFLRATTTASMDIPGPVRDGRDRGLLQHDAARSEVDRPRTSRSS